MKRIVLTIIAVVMSTISITAQNDERSRVEEDIKRNRVEEEIKRSRVEEEIKRSRVEEEIKRYYHEKAPMELLMSMSNLAQKYGYDNDISLSNKVNPESGRLISSVTTIPFSSAKAFENVPMDEILSGKANTVTNDFEQIIADVESKFQSCMSQAYTVGNTRQGDSHTSINTLTGDNPSDMICILAQDESASLLYMETKNTDDPEMRDFYAIKWKEQVGCTSGIIYLIKSKRPDLVLKEQQGASSSKARNIDEEMMDYIDVSDKFRINLLGQLIENYDEELNALFEKREQFGYDKKIKKITTLTEKQIEYTIKKRQEALNKLHNIIMNIDY